MFKRFVVMMVVLTSMLIIPAAEGHTPTNPHPRVQFWENYYRGQEFSVEDSRCLGAIVAAYEHAPNVYSANSGQAWCRDYIAPGGIGVACPYGVPCYGYPAYSINIGDRYIMNRFVGNLTDQRGVMYHAVAHETGHNWLAKQPQCYGDPSCGTHEGECYADYVAHHFFDSRPRYYSSYKTWCSDPARVYRSAWLTSYH